jgi:glyoxylase-like metal-dependent hydrolase (beta-lactamase superfamily II)
VKTWKTKAGLVVRQLLGGRSNVFLVTGDGASILVDTSWNQAWKPLQSRLEGLGFDGSGTLAALVLTHTHFDHAANAARLHQRYHVPVIVHRCEAEYLQAGDSPLPLGTTVFTRWVTPRLTRGVRRFFRYSPAAPDILVDETFDLRPLGIEADLLHTPGHSPGSISLIVGGEVALVGDAMYGVVPGSAFPPFAADARQLVESWASLLNTGCQVFLPSHGGAVTRPVVEQDYSQRHGRLPTRA